MFSESDEAGIGVVIRDFDGVVMASLSKKIMKLPLVEALELLAARRAISFTMATCFTSTIFKGDFEWVVKSLQRRGMEHSQGGHLIKDIWSYANSL